MKLVRSEEVQPQSTLTLEEEKDKEAEKKKYWENKGKLDKFKAEYHMLRDRGEVLEKSFKKQQATFQKEVVAMVP